MRLTRILCAALACAPVLCEGLRAGELDRRPEPRATTSDGGLAATAATAVDSAGTHSSRVPQPGAGSQASGGDRSQNPAPAHDPESGHQDPVRPEAPDMFSRISGSRAGEGREHPPLSENAKAVRALLNAQAGGRLTGEPLPRHGRSSRPDADSDLPAGWRGVGARMGGPRDASAAGGGAVNAATATSAAANSAAVMPNAAIPSGGAFAERMTAAAGSFATTAVAGGIPATAAATATRQSAEAVAGSAGASVNGLKSVAGDAVVGGPARAAGSGVIGGAPAGTTAGQAARIDGTSLRRKF